MREDYKAAKRLAEAAVRKAESEGVSPYLPVLDALEDMKTSLPQIRLGIMELPLSRITGNKEQGRNNAFANNFMPLMEDGSEFAMKWSDLYDSYKMEGIREAIKVYEFMNRYYVQEGNKRVSVSKYGGTEYITADVIRVLPPKNRTKEVKVYYEYLEFYNVTKNHLILFSKPDSYRTLAALLGQDLEHEWPEDLCRDLKASFYRFSKCVRQQLKLEDDYAISDAFLMYIAIFPFRTLEDTSTEQLLKNIQTSKKDILTYSTLENRVILDSAPEAPNKKDTLRSIFTSAKRYTAKSPLRVGFVYDDKVEHSRWIDSHEAGRLYVDAVLGENVKTEVYSATGGRSIKEMIDQACGDKMDMIFTVSPFMLQDTLIASVRNPNVKFLNCTVGYSTASVRCYQGKIFEPSFLLGILAADMLLRANPNGERKIGYLSRHMGSRKRINLNAFAIGVSLIDPECKVVIQRADHENVTDYREVWKQQGIEFYADIEYSMVLGDERLGLYRIGETSDTFIGTPYYSWGKYYAQIIQTVLMGTWKSDSERTMSANFWFGMSTGVVDIRTKDLPYQTDKLLRFFRKAIIDGSITPFSGMIKGQDGSMVQEDIAMIARKRLEFGEMTPDMIISMDWLNENIVGEI